MNTSTEGKPIKYTIDFIDRRGDLRKNHDRIIARIREEGSQIIPVWQDLHLVDEDRLVFLDHQHPWIDQASTIVFLGVGNGRSYYSIDVSQLDKAQAVNNPGSFEDLRKIGARMSDFEAGLAVYSRGIHYWHRTHTYCSRCGCKLKSHEGGHSRICTSKDCKHVTYPRIAPAVIVLIEHHGEDGPMCLLGKGQRAWGNIRSTLAGFVEVGESLEEAVCREMKEEAGIDVENIRYMGSQPWPFPSSLMVGFFAESKSTDIKIDEDEILEARWYKIPEMKRMVDKGELILSREDSIARYLIETWVSLNQ